MSDTPRTDAKEKETEALGAAGYGINIRGLQKHAHYGWKFARQLERELGEERGWVVHWQTGYSAASGAADALRAEVERLRAALGVYLGEGPEHTWKNGMCPDQASSWNSRDPECKACALLSAALQEPTR